jgi:hypothetical protein
LVRTAKRETSAPASQSGNLDNNKAGVACATPADLEEKSVRLTANAAAQEEQRHQPGTNQA